MIDQLAHARLDAQARSRRGIAQVYRYERLDGTLLGYDVSLVRMRDSESAEKGTRAIVLETYRDGLRVP